MLYTPLHQIFNHSFTVKKWGICKGGQAKFVTVMNDCNTRLATFFSYVDDQKGKYGDYIAKDVYIPVDNYVKGNKVKVYGTTFELQQRKSLKGDLYWAVLYGGRKIGIFNDLKRVLRLNNICIIPEKFKERKV